VQGTEGEARDQHVTFGDASPSAWGVNIVVGTPPPPPPGTGWSWLTGLDDSLQADNEFRRVAVNTTLTAERVPGTGSIRIAWGEEGVTFSPAGINNIYLGAQMVGGGEADMLPIGGGGVVEPTSPIPSTEDPNTRAGYRIEMAPPVVTGDFGSSIVEVSLIYLHMPGFELSFRYTGAGVPDRRSTDDGDTTLMADVGIRGLFVDPQMLAAGPVYCRFNDLSIWPFPEDADPGTWPGGFSSINVSIKSHCPAGSITIPDVTVSYATEAEVAQFEALHPDKVNPSFLG
jgi:hypothetical protein